MKLREEYWGEEIFRDEYNRGRRKRWVAYLAWLIGGVFGLHRFYLKDYFAGAVMAVLTIFSFGLLGIVGFIDVIYIERNTAEYNRRLHNELSKAYRRQFLKGAY